MMTFRQKVLKIVYPLLMLSGRVRRKKSSIVNTQNIMPPCSFYELQIELNNNTNLDFSTLKGKKVLLVNTASNCGYTRQYADLQQLYKAYKNQLEIIGIPANDFKEQEKGTDEEIAQFCHTHFGVSFPLTKKSTVIKSEKQHPVYQWLTDKKQNGWNTQLPTWNFCKYLINEKGILTHFFDSSVSPLSASFLKQLLPLEKDENE